MPAPPVLRLSGTGDGTISCPVAANEGAGSRRGMGHCPAIGGGAVLSIRLEDGERRREGHGDVAHAGQRGVSAVKLGDELHLLPEQRCQLSALP